MPSRRPLLLLALCCLAALARAVDAAPVTFDFKLASIPGTITLCRDPVAAQAYGVDHEYLAYLDLDGSTATGDPATGAETLLIVTTLGQSNPCSPHSVSASAAFVAAMVIWNNGAWDYANPISLTTSVDTATATLSAFGDDGTAPLSGLRAASRVQPAAFGTYSSAGTPKIANDNVAVFTRGTAPGSSASDPAGDVQNCSSPCSAAANWYPLVDVLGVTVSSTPPPGPPAFGVNTIDIEFAVQQLPTNITLCANPAPFLNQSGYDLAWAALVNVSGAPGSDASFGYGEVILAHTPLQSPGCIPASATLAGTLQADLFHWDSAQSLYVLDASLPAKVDAGRIVVNANRADPRLASLSAASLVAKLSAVNTGFPFSVVSLVSTYPRDSVPEFHFGTAYTDPVGDVCSSSASCTSTGSPQIDLVAGAMRMNDWLFRSGFE